MKIVHLIVFVFFSVFLFFSCSKGGDSFKQGEERGPCYEDNTCNDGLVCLSKTCVNPNKTGEEGGPCYLNGGCNKGLVCVDDICIKDADYDDFEESQNKKDDDIIFIHFDNNQNNPDNNTQPDIEQIEEDITDIDEEILDSDSDEIIEQPDENSGEWTLYASLNWSSRSDTTMSWKAADNYCGAMGGRLPTISELRMLIESCTDVQTGGLCGVTDSCPASSTCYTSKCDGCSSASDGKYSYFDDTVWLWSSTTDSTVSDQAWAVRYTNASVYYYNKASMFHARCVKL
jgi:hypothetical protein